MSGIVTTCYYLSTFIPIAIIDRVGRRPLLIGGVLVMGLCMFVLAGTTSVNHFATGIVSTVTIFIYLFGFGIGWIPGPWLVASEYAPLATRSQTAALATSATWIFSFLIAEITPISITNIGYKSYIIFGLLNMAFVPILYFLYPEVSMTPLQILASLKSDTSRLDRLRGRPSSKLISCFQVIKSLSICHPRRHKRWKIVISNAPREPKLGWSR
jgi:MFS family permease